MQVMAIKAPILLQEILSKLNQLPITILDLKEVSDKTPVPMMILVVLGKEPFRQLVLELAAQMIQ
jgi:hypothetical protein